MIAKTAKPLDERMGTFRFACFSRDVQSPRLVANHESTGAEALFRPYFPVSGKANEGAKPARAAISDQSISAHWRGPDNDLQDADKQGDLAEFAGSLLTPGKPTVRCRSVRFGRFRA